MPHDDFRHAFARHRGAFDGFTLPGAETHYPPDLELEPVHLDIDLAFDLEAETCAGTVTITVEARRAGPTSLRLNAVAFEDLAADDPDGGDMTWRYDGQEIAIDWAEPFAPEERRRVAVRYRVERPTAGLYFSKPSDAYPAAPWFVASDHETERARHWLPCIDLPNARPRLDIHLRAPARFTILANGALVDEAEHGDGTKTAHWRLDFPCPSYLTCVAIGDLVRADDGEHEGAPIAYFAPPPSTADDLLRSFGRTGKMLDWMTGKLGMAFPFPKYFQFALPSFGGAMENISLVSWDAIFVMDETLAAEWTRLLDEINVHEMAHSFFGDAVVCRDYAHAWLKESWATYIEQVWFEDTAGPDEQLYQYFRDAHSYFAEADERYMRPLVTREFNSSWDMYDAHLYPGGACRLHTLRQELGDQVFWAGVRDYLGRFAGQVVETDDFRRVLEKHSGRSLGRFFDQWFHGKGYPAIKVAFKYDAKRHEGTFEIKQTQVDEKAGVPAFDLKADVGWTIDGQAHSQPVRLEGEAKKTVIVPMAADPEQVRFDPRAKVLHKLDFNPGDAKLRAQLAGAPDVIGRILAGRALAKSGKRKNIEAVRDAYRAEPFWGVRVELAKALGRAGVAAAVEALVELVAWEEDPMVLASLLGAAGRYRDPALADAVEARLEDGLPYLATQMAYLALGAQRQAAPFKLLRQAATEQGFGDFAQSGALRALAATRHRKALPLLGEATVEGASPSRARAAAVGALAAAGRLTRRREREDVTERLIDLLRDPDRQVRGAAVGGLAAMGAGAAVPALQAYRGPLAVQEQVRVDRALAAIRKGDEPKRAKLEKELEELRTKLRKVGDRVEKLEARAQAGEAGAAKAEDDAAEEESEGS